MIIDLELDDKSKLFIQKAKNEYKNWCDSLSIDYILYEGLTKEACKKFKVSPDCIMQLGFQVMWRQKIRLFNKKQTTILNQIRLYIW